MRFKNIRKQSTSKEIQLLIKGSNEMLGADEVIYQKDLREKSCVCISETAEVLQISKEVTIT